MAVQPSPEDATWILTLPPTRRQSRWVRGVAVSQVAALAIVAPFAKMPLAQIQSFIPAFDAFIFVTDLITSILLFSQFAIFRAQALLILACGYLFSALLIVPHALTFPGAFSPAGLLGAGLQSTAWLYWLWHLLFGVALLGYGLMGHRSVAPQDQPAAVVVIVRSATIVVVLACGLTLLATAGNDHLPYSERVGMTSVQHFFGAVTMLTSASALVVLSLRRRSLLDEWLMIVALAAILEVGLGVISVIFSSSDTSRFSLGFYAGRLFSLLTSTVLLVVLLAETMRLYANVARTNARLQREQSSRLMNLDAMIASIAHEIRQPLAAIVTHAQAAQRFLGWAPPDIPTAQKSLSGIIESGNRVSEVFENIRALFRRGDLKETSIDVNKLTEQVLDSFADDFSRRCIVARAELSSPLPPVRGHRGQLQEVLFNLVQNAIEAMELVAEDHRVLHVRTALDGEWIGITVQDSGPGLDEKIASNLFNAFISTKSTGMGLGLAICQMFIEGHGGRISASAAFPRGASFQVQLPAVECLLQAHDRSASDLDPVRSMPCNE